MIRPLCAALAILLFAGCMDQDPFGLSRRTVAGDYRLEQWEDFTTYYLVGGGPEQPGGSALGGTVTHIGWNRRYVVARRHANFRGDGDGWMIVDVERRTVAGPFSDAELARRPEARGIVPVTASEAWDRLPRKPLPFMLLGVLAAWLLSLRHRRSRRAAPDVS
jgi:hypothetical protein